MFKLCYYVLILVLFASCVKSIENNIDLNLSIDEDKEYYKTYLKYTKKFELIKNFETHAIVNITFLSNEFTQAFTKRYQNLYYEPQNFFDTSSTDKLGFFVSITSDNMNLRKLDNNNLWNIFLQHQEETLPPEIIKRLGEKDRWIPFFKEVTKWSEEYLILFKTNVKQNENMVYTNKIKLVLACAEGKIIAEY